MDVDADRIAVLDDIITGFYTSSPRRDLLSGETDEVVLVSVVLDKKASKKDSKNGEEKWVEHWEKRRVVGRTKHSDGLLDAMKTEGWLVEWAPTENELECLRPWLGEDTIQGPSLTLSEWAAEVLGVEVGTDEDGNWSRWMKAGHRSIDDDDADHLLSLPSIVLPSWGNLAAQPERYIEDGYYAYVVPEKVDPAPGPVETAIAREELAMREEVVTTYDAEKDEVRVETVREPLKVWGMAVPVDGKVRGKKSNRNGRKTA